MQVSLGHSCSQSRMQEPKEGCKRLLILQLQFQYNLQLQIHDDFFKLWNTLNLLFIDKI